MADTASVDAPVSNGGSHTITNYVPSIRRISKGESNARIRNRFEFSRLTVQLKHIDKEIELNEKEHRKEMRLLRESMRSVRESTGVTEQPELKSKSTKSLINEEELSKTKTTRSDSTTSYTFNYELIHKQAEENFGMLYNSFPIKGIQDPIYQYNPTFLRIKETASGDNSGHTSRLGDHDNEDQDEYYNSNGIQNLASAIMNDDELTNREVKNRGFKMTVDDSTDEEEEEETYKANDILQKYKDELKKFEDHGIPMTFNEDETEKLEQIYDDLRNAKSAFPNITKEKIENLKQKDPVFAKRYRQFSAAKSAGKVPIYEAELQPARRTMPRSALERRKKQMMQPSEIKATVRENPYIEEQQKLNDRVSKFVKDLSIK